MKIFFTKSSNQANEPVPLRCPKVEECPFTAIPFVSRQKHEKLISFLRLKTHAKEFSRTGPNNRFVEMQSKWQ